MPRPTLLPPGAAVACACVLLACGADRPTDDEVRRALAEDSRTTAKGCVGFTALPGGRLPAAAADGYAAELPTLVRLGLLEPAGAGYRLTRAGQASFDPLRRGFCYNSGYTVQRVRIERIDDAAALADSPLAAGYTIGFDRVPTDPQAWIRDPGLQSRLRDWRAADFGSRRYTARFFRREPGQPLQVNALSFALPPSLGFVRHP